MALAGRLIDVPDADVARFPLEHVNAVRDRLRDLFQALSAQSLVASGAAGADLLAHEVAAELGLAREVVLPFSIAEFQVKSVNSRPGPWAELFAQLVATPMAGLTLTVLDGGSADPYDAANLVILEHARRTSETKGLRPTAVLVWEGRSRGKGDSTADFRDHAAAMAFDVVETLTL